MLAIAMREHRGNGKRRRRVARRKARACATEALVTAAKSFVAACARKLRAQFPPLLSCVGPLPAARFAPLPAPQSRDTKTRSLGTQHGTTASIAGPPDDAAIAHRGSSLPT